MATLAESQTTLALYKTERDTILAAGIEEMSIGDQSHRNHQLDKLEKHIDKYEAMVRELSGNTGFGVVKMRGMS